jgi:transposase
MLSDPSFALLSDHDARLCRSIVPENHVLCKALAVVPWDDFHELLAPYYSRDKGRPADSPVMMLKLEYLRYHYNLSDREVIARATTDLAFRLFLQISPYYGLPDPTSLHYFRARLGKEGFRTVFHRLVGVAREHGLVKDRLRIKDATHVLADIAVPTALALVAQTRDKLLAAAAPFAPQLVEGEQINLDLLRENTRSRKDAERLASRVAHLREMLYWIDDVTPPADAPTNRGWQTFLAQRDLAHKILEDQEHPQGGDRTISTTDPDARCGRHGQFYDGYLVDLLVDADSQIVTAVNVLPANGDEAADAAELIRQEEAAHGNDVQAVSIDGVGFNGPVLRELQDPDGLNLDVFVPTPNEADGELFTPQDFEEDVERGVVTCPAGQTSHERHHESQKRTTKYRFEAAVCRTCRLLSRCMKQPPKQHGRSVCKSDYQVEHNRARKKTTTPEYAAVRREHPLVERKLGEVMNRHGGRRARYRGQPKVLVQQLMAATATNLKRLVRLLDAPTARTCCAT